MIQRKRGLEQLLDAVASCCEEEKQHLFEVLRRELPFHELEREFAIKAEQILDAISRGSDLTKRGVRGVIAETIFATEIAPKVPGWEAADPSGDEAFDVLMRRGSSQVRVQVKMQRKEKGVPLRRSLHRGLPRDHYVVEVQRTRSGRGVAGQATRPYRFDEFDLLAVCMEPSMNRWDAFLYIPARELAERPDDPGLISTMQLVPPYPAMASSKWTSNLAEALERVCEPSPPRLLIT